MAKQAQIDKFKQAAREIEADDDEKHFDERLEKIARQRPAPIKTDRPKGKPKGG